MSGCRTSRHQAGFTLIECLVALAILALAAAAVHRSFAGGAAGLAITEQRSEAVDVARAILAKAGVEAPLVPGRSAGTLGRIAWTLTIDVHQRPSGQRGVLQLASYTVTATAATTGEQDRPPVVLTTIKLAPTEPSP
jgi:prepilin-type N-terminal cleavage/methylation domain-containing protein